MITEKNNLSDYFSVDFRTRREVVEDFVNIFGPNIGISQDSLYVMERGRDVHTSRTEGGEIIIERIDTSSAIRGSTGSVSLHLREEDINNKIVFPTILAASQTNNMRYSLSVGEYSGYCNKVFVYNAKDASYLQFTELTNRSGDIGIPVESVRTTRYKKAGKEELVYATVAFSENWIQEELGVMTLDNSPVHLVFLKDTVVATTPKKEVIVEMFSGGLAQHGMRANLINESDLVSFSFRFEDTEFCIDMGKLLRPNYAERAFASNNGDWLTTSNVNLISPPFYSEN